MKLSYLLQDLITFPVDTEITGLTLHSRLIKPGYLFFACRGTSYDGKNYIPQALERGASAIVTDSDSGDIEITEISNKSCIKIPTLRKYLGPLAARFYNYPSKKMKIIGVTGTNGKTSCSHFIASALKNYGTTCGIIGTLGAGLYGNVQSGTLTTPDALSLHEIFSKFVSDYQAKVVAMEVSSHAIDQERITGIDFEVGIFTNLSQDHLDYHGTMENYAATKKRLFDNPHLKTGVINYDDAFGKNIIETLSKHKNLYAYSVDASEKPDIPITKGKVIDMNLDGFEMILTSPWGSGFCNIPLIGKFNMSNVLAVFTTLCVLNIPFKEALNAMTQLQPVAGRMQTIRKENKPLVVVDYAHSPDSLEKVLAALRTHCQGKLICVFGCGGNRDKGKRPLMAKAAEKYADKIVLTNDNPRLEKPEDIINDILKGFKNPNNVFIQYDRSKAIQEVIQYASVNDCILIAGKGAEDYQIIGDEKIPFSDVEKVNAFMAE